MQFFLQTLANSVSYGALLALAAVGMALLFGVMRVMNFAHGEMIAMGAYAAFFGIGVLGWNPLVVGVLVVLAGGVLGWILQRTLLGAIADQGELPPILITYALHSMFVGLLYVLFTGKIRRYESPLSGVVNLGDVQISVHAIVVAAIAGGCYVALTVFLFRSKLGLGIRATAQHRSAAAASGINLSSIDSLTFALSVSLAALSGFLLSMQISIAPEMGQHLLLQVLIVIVLGGMGRIQGALVGGLLVGVLWTLGNTFFGGTVSALLFYVTAYLLLVTRGTGVFSRKESLA